MEENKLTIEEVIKKHYRATFVAIETVAALLNFVKHKKEPEKTLAACLAYRGMKPSTNRRGIIQRQFNFSSETVYRICNECDKLKL